MWIVRGLIDRLLLILAVVAGGLVPGFIAQYRQRLGGRLDQARLDLEPWQKLADQSFHGDLDKLIQYHLGSTDPTFHAEGGIIRALVSTVQQLQAAADALHASLWQQMQYLALHADPDLLRATFNDWIPTFALSAEGIVFALAFALLVWLIFHALWWLISAGRGRLTARRQRAAAL
jgi:phytoene dehydrogenase-like protein